METWVAPVLRSARSDAPVFIEWMLKHIYGAQYQASTGPQCSGTHHRVCFLPSGSSPMAGNTSSGKIAAIGTDHHRGTASGLGWGLPAPSKSPFSMYKMGSSPQGASYPSSIRGLRKPICQETIISNNV